MNITQLAAEIGKTPQQREFVQRMIDDRADMIALLSEIKIAVAVTHEVISRHRLAGTDQNPKGFVDLLGSAHLKLERWNAP